MLFRKIMFSTIAITLSLLISLIFVEAVLRLVDGYYLGSLRLIAKKKPPTRNDQALNSELMKKTQDYVSKLKTPKSINLSWFTEQLPESANRLKVDPDLEKRFRSNGNYNMPSIYVWNKKYLEKELCRKGNKLVKLDSFLCYQPVDDRPFPRFRFPRNTKLPSKLVTNKFGWRGKDIELKKPPNTIRIAFVGASTTVGGHGMHYSYPEYIEFWLNLWAKKNNKRVRFEIVNTGREGTNSNDFVAVVENELLPIEPDLVVYYEGSNQFWPAHFVKWKDGRLPKRPKITFPEPSWIEKHSAIAKRIGFLFVKGLKITFGGGKLLESPRDGFLGVQWPQDLDEMNPQLDHAKLPLNLPVILNDLGSIKDSIRKIGGELIICSFIWMVQPGMELDYPQHRNLYVYLNQTFWAMPYAHMRRMADFQNRVFKKFAHIGNVPYINLAEEFPQNPVYFTDAVHMNSVGTRLKGWIVFKDLVPILDRKIQSGALPRPANEDFYYHPAFVNKDMIVEKSEILSKCE